MTKLLQCDQCGTERDLADTETQVFTLKTPDGMELDFDSVECLFLAAAELAGVDLAEDKKKEEPAAQLERIEAATRSGKLVPQDGGVDFHPPTYEGQVTMRS